MKTFSRTISLIGMTIKQKLMYPGAVWFGLLSSFISVLLFYFLWTAIYSPQQSFQGYDLSMMMTYVVLSRVLVAQFSGGINGELADLIYDGNIAVELLRPIGFIRLMFAKKIGDFFQTALLRLLPVAVIMGIVLRISAPKSILIMLLFVTSVLLSVVILFFLEFMVGLLAFYTDNYYGLVFAKDALLTILSGVWRLYFSSL